MGIPVPPDARCQVEVVNYGADKTPMHSIPVDHLCQALMSAIPLTGVIIGINTTNKLNVRWMADSTA